MKNQITIFIIIMKITLKSIKLEIVELDKCCKTHIYARFGTAEKELVATPATLAKKDPY